MGNDLCAGAIALNVHAPGDPTQHVTGDTSSAHGEFSGLSGSDTCGGSGPDIFYSLHLTAAARITATVTATGAGAADYVPVVDLLASCADTAGLSCGGDGQSNAATDDNFSVAAGDYILVVDGYGGSAGTFTLDVTASAPVTPPANDICTGATALNVHTAGDHVSVTGDTSVSFDNYSSPVCSQNGSKGDLFYAINLTAKSSLHVDVQAASGSNIDPILGLIPSCVATTELVCVGGNVLPGNSLDIGSLAAGNYILVVDGDTANGAFTLNVSAGAAAAAPSNDVCASATALTAVTGPGTSATVTGTTIGAADDGDSLVCGGETPGGDVFYAFTLTADSHLTATLDLTDGGNSLGVLALLPGCTLLADGGGELACVGPTTDPSQTVLNVNDLHAGNYILAVDNVDLLASNFNLKVAATAAIPPPTNDLCSAATVLTTLTGPGTSAAASGTTVDAANDNGGSICGTQARGSDVYYKFTTTAAADFTATLVDADGNAVGLLSLDSACGASATDLGCAGPGQQDPTTSVLSLYALPAGTYVLTVANYDTHTSAFTLNVSLTTASAVPANDVCSNAIALTKGTQVTGTTIGAATNVHLPASNMCTNFASDGADVFYSFTPATSGSYDFNLTTTSNADFNLELFTDCPTSASDCGTGLDGVGGIDDGLAGDPETLTVTLTAGTTYLLHVAGYSGADVGPFSLTVIQTPPPKAAKPVKEKHSKHAHMAKKAASKKSEK